ncbi:glycosyltransferase [Thermopirellula anaerolimosa]
MARPDVSIIISTYQRPRNLRLCLLAVTAQRDFPYKTELIVADDGSQDETAEIVERFQSETGTPVKFRTHPHDGFRAALTRNEGFAVSTAPYVLFLDGDCLIPPDHLAVHFRLRRPGLALTTDAVRWDREVSAACGENHVVSGEFTRHVPRAERRRLRIAHWKAVLYHRLRHPNKPRLLGGNFSVWRQDLEAINGFDENYNGWGCEDDDVGIRLHQLGVRVYSIRRHTHTFHLWHPPVDSVPDKIREGSNFRYFQRRGRLTRCRNGLKKREASDLHVVLSGVERRDPWLGRLQELGMRPIAIPSPEAILSRPEPSPGPACWMAGPGDRIAQHERPRIGPSDAPAPRFRPDQAHVGTAAAVATESPPCESADPEIEIAVWPRVTAFHGRADCRVLLIAENSVPHRRLSAEADIILGPWESPPGALRLVRGARYFPLSQLEEAAAAIQ